ncbi:peptidase [Secundilactobacillus kimchicus]|uniref:Ig-like domain-containing protein n=1 Tax=Secundilactobacillus kimchicus TaxID=528209 RepID=UPI001C012066|nr:Ig-like domain-containing protein [Secundilactobacillus kimchicus]MBT9670641.1 peptidase [Secundilactobacillus kimchicus]
MKKLFGFVAGLGLALGLFGAGQVASAATSPSLSVNPISASSTTVTGKATKGVRIIVRSVSKKTLANAQASAKTGAFKVTLPAKQKAGTKLYVYARNSSTKAYFYRIMTVQATNTTTSTTSSNKGATTPSNGTQKTANFKAPATPTGLWTSNTYKGYKMAVSFRQSTGLNQRVYLGKKTAAPLTNAAYSVDAKTPTFWAINVRAKGGAKTTFYIRYTAANKFILVNSKNQAVKMSFGKAPAGHYVFTLNK